MLNFYPIARLNNDLIHYFLPKIPPDVDLIVAIPRDGILVASLISLYRQIPFTDLGSFLEGRVYRPGIKHRIKENYNREIRAILLTDDICATGAAMREAKSDIAKLKSGIKVYAATLYVIYGGESKIRSGLIDFYGCEMKSRSCYEWTQCDMFRSIKTIYDFDGVLCEDCRIGNDDGGERYKKFLANTPLKLKPKEIGAIITWRPEKFRTETEDWLRKHGITYKQLIMAEREKWANPIEFKAYHYKKLPFTLMIESSTKQAQKINELTNKPVISLENQQIYQ